MDKEKKESLNELLSDIRQGDVESITRLYEVMSPTVRYIALKYLGNESDADDLVQDFWLDIEKYAKGYLFRKNAYGYLCKVMTRQAINRYKKLKRQAGKNIEFVDYLKVENFQNDIPLGMAELRNDINEAMLKLDGLQRIIVQETYFEGKTIRQIAKDIGISKSQAGRLKIRAIEILKTELSKKGWDNEDV